jgi:hypothetical protein
MQTETDKTTIRQLREIRDKISFDIKDLTPRNLKEYLGKQRALYPKTNQQIWN